jgi:hypothetical protein
MRPGAQADGLHDTGAGKNSHRHYTEAQSGGGLLPATGMFPILISGVESSFFVSCRRVMSYHEAWVWGAATP